MVTLSEVILNCSWKMTGRTCYLTFIWKGIVKRLGDELNCWRKAGRSLSAVSLIHTSRGDCFWMYPITGLNSKYFLVYGGWTILKLTGP